MEMVHGGQCHLQVGSLIVKVDHPVVIHFTQNNSSLNLFIITFELMTLGDLLAEWP